ncbi:hypothetical protein DOTSEDRAFT_73557 [Dothistroma septosporum NZE10]|uniref:Rhodopsin domain-containing protein n=1 Tax=Dothistroma septosporum (strain NZE10 / CBS 128990) TaxID=675120 RepID=N1PFM9_DOTSN|nr:hypothetical protein DOTSEDRAFT_73557 [Dothistroma septosporum NZE10]
MSIPDTLSPALAVINEDDQRGVLWTVGVICFAFIYLTFAVRLFVRWRRFQVDDYAILVACILILAEVAAAFAAVAMGLGTKALMLQSADQIQTVWQLFIASEAFYILATWTAKGAVLLTVRELLSRDAKMRIVFHLTLAAVAALGLASLLAVTIHCGSESLTPIMTRHCNQEPRWIAVAVADSVTEIWGFSLFCCIVWSLQMRWKYKWTSAAILGLRLFCIVFAGVHAYYITVFEKDPDPAVGVIQPLAWQQVGLTWSLLSAMVVALRPFLRDFHTGFGMDLATRHDSIYGQGSNKYSAKGYRLQELSGHRYTESRSAHRDTSKDPRPGNTSNQFRADDIQYSAAIYHGARKPSEGSMRSHDPIIRREVEYTVTYENS